MKLQRIKKDHRTTSADTYFVSPAGISLTAEQWATFKKNIPGVEQAIKKLESKS
uniref:RNA polymerase II transcriptional coactivator KELP n=1 Tax=Solanum tuberosum TaxID=4113 RepID=M1AWL4_SOLTU